MKNHILDDYRVSKKCTACTWDNLIVDKIDELISENNLKMTNDVSDEKLCKIFRSAHAYRHNLKKPQTMTTIISKKDNNPFVNQNNCPQINDEEENYEPYYIIPQKTINTTKSDDYEERIEQSFAAFY